MSMHFGILKHLIFFACINRTSVIDLNLWHTIKATYLSSVNYVFLEIDGNLVDLGLLEVNAYVTDEYTDFHYNVCILIYCQTYLFSTTLCHKKIKMLFPFQLQ